MTESLCQKKAGHSTFSRGRGLRCAKCDERCGQGRQGTNRPSQRGVAGREKTAEQTAVLQIHVAVRILQVPLVIDEPVVTGHVAVNVAVRTGCKSARRCPHRKSTASGGHGHITWDCGYRAAVKPGDRRADPESICPVLIPIGVTGGSGGYPAD